ncbi:hypothetical protein [Pseudomonas syringae]|uniref:hypothetical protein n=1 Tax=Pseudomonas syringae TaxID=317 RepID=UPI001F203CCB|nr:hypothetical protein [Pseudomonas syringae]
MELGLLHQLTNTGQALFGRVRFDKLQGDLHAFAHRHFCGVNHVQIIRLDASESDLKVIVTIEQLAQLIKQLLNPHLQPRFFIARQLAAFGRRLATDQELSLDDERVMDNFNSIHGCSSNRR